MPYHYSSWHRPFMYRGPSRLLWFAIGAVSATWWIKRHDERRVWGHCRRPALRPNDMPPPSTEDQDPWKTKAAEISRTINNLNPDEHPPSPPWDDKEFQQHKEHFTKVTRQAGEAVYDVTESTLESVIAAAEVMRLKVAEKRKIREIQEEARRQKDAAEQAHNSNASDPSNQRLV